MTATVNGQPVSLIELAGGKVAAMLAARRARRAGRPSRGIFSMIGQLLGTIVPLGCFVAAGFLVTLALGLAVTGVALLLLDFKITVIRRNRAAQRRRR